MERMVKAICHIYCNFAHLCYFLFKYRLTTKNALKKETTSENKQHRYIFSLSYSRYSNLREILNVDFALIF